MEYQILKFSRMKFNLTIPVCRVLRREQINKLQAGDDSARYTVGHRCYRRDCSSSDTSLSTQRAQYVGYTLFRHLLFKFYVMRRNGIAV